MNKSFKYIAIFAFLGVLIFPVYFAYASETNSAPIFSPIANKAGFYGEVISFNVSAYDSNGDELTYTMTNGPAGSYFDPARRQFAWTPKSYQIGNNAVAFAVFDGVNYAYEDAIIVVSTPSPLPESLASNSNYEVVERYDIFGIFNNSNKRKSSSTNSGFGFFNFGSKNKSESKTEVKKSEDELSVSSIEIKRDGNGVIVSWKTNKPSSERVIYDIDSEANKTKNFTYDYATPENYDLDKNHSVKLIGLGENKTYYLRVVSADSNKKVISNELAFTLDNNLSSAGAFAGGFSFLKNPFLYIAIILFVLFLVYLKRRKSSKISGASGIASDIPTVASLKI